MCNWGFSFGGRHSGNIAVLKCRLIIHQAQNRQDITTKSQVDKCVSALLTESDKAEDSETWQQWTYNSSTVAIFFGGSEDKQQ